MKAILLTIILSFITSLVKSQDVNVEVLKKDPDLVAYRKIGTTIKEQMQSKYITFPPNMKNLQSTIMQSSSVDELKKTLKANGMLHADEFVDEISTQKALMVKFNKNHPELNNLDAKQKRNIFVKLISN